MADLTDVDLAIADADALRLLSKLRAGCEPRGFFPLTRVIGRVVRRVVTGDASRAVRYPTTADYVLHALLNVPNAARGNR